MTLKRTPIKRKIYHINKYSKKRQEQVREYNKLIKEKHEVKNHICYFCGKIIEYSLAFHHITGRDNEKLIDEKYLVPCHNDEHLYYHSSPVSLLLKTDWYESVFLVNLKRDYPDVYEKELKKFEK